MTGDAHDHHHHDDHDYGRHDDHGGEEQGRRHGHSHDHGAMGDVLAEGSAEGIRSLRISAAGLGATAIIQFVVVAIGGSVALLADALHNLGDVFTTVSLWIAFVATRRAADHRYTFGYQRFEDLAGLVIVGSIFVSAGLAMYESVTHLMHGSVPTHLAVGMAAGAVGVVGNEAVAQVKIRAGRKIDSPALIAEGQHSRVDGLASAGAIVGLAGVAVGAGWADAVAGLLIALVILYIGYDSGKPIVARLVDRVDPELIERIAQKAAEVEEVVEVHAIRARWAGRSLYVLLHIALPEDITLERAHAHGEEVRHAILHALPQVVQVDVHIDPFGQDIAAYHEATSHHFEGH
jgi:cation diffusion facilitator family transporter